MQRLITAVSVLGILALVAGLSAIGALPQPEHPELKIQVEETNPWSNLKLNNQSRNFQFAVITDRTGGHRPGVFQQAVNKLNLLQPEFVVSVGDLIEGYTEDRGQWALEWAEFQSKVNQLEMPFFYVPGNHDISNSGMEANWKRKFGRTYFDFRYQDVLFLALNSEDPPNSKPYGFGAEQQAWLRKVLAENADARWTFVFMHKPAWTYPDDDPQATGWTAIEESLLVGNRNFTVFAGHKHNYGRYVRNGRDYIMLATTGGGSKLRGTAEGEFDHFVWVTMKDGNPVIANITLDGVLDKTLRTLPEPKPTPKKAAQ